MCTLTLIPISAPGSGPEIRLAFNRDESRIRPAASPPQLRRLGDHLAMMPIDPVSSGTWIGANDSGLICALLNAYPAQVRSVPKTVSRGEIIPRLLERCATVDQAIDHLSGWSFQDYAPFRLAMLSGWEVVDLAWDGDRSSWGRAHRLERPWLLTSSGLGDEVVRPAREALFRAWFEDAAPQDWPRLQDNYHRHSWPDQTRLSVCMRRESACTVSFTILEADESAIDWAYYSGAPDEAADAEMARLLIQRRTHR